MQKIDFGKLLGFATLPGETKQTDFSDETVGARLGAKVGTEFDPANKDIDFQDETLAAKLGAKVGSPEA